MIPPWVSPFGDPPAELPYHLRTVAELECEPEWVRREYLGHELVPGGGVSTTGAPGTHQDADGAVEAPADGAAGTAVGVTPRRVASGAAPSAQAPPSLPVARGKTTDPSRRVGRDSGFHVLYAALVTALVITAAYVVVRVAQWHLIGGG